MDRVKSEQPNWEQKSVFHLSTVIDLKTQITEYFEVPLAMKAKHIEEDQNGICSILLMDFLIELAHTLHSKFRTIDCLENVILVKATPLYACIGLFQIQRYHGLKQIYHFVN